MTWEYRRREPRSSGGRRLETPSGQATPNNERIDGSVSEVGEPTEQAGTSGSSSGLLSRQASNPASQQESNQASIFSTEEAGTTTEHTEKQGFWRFAQECGHTPHEAPKLVFSVCSVVLPASSVLKILT